MASTATSLALTLTAALAVALLRAALAADAPSGTPAQPATPAAAPAPAPAPSGLSLPPGAVHILSQMPAFEPGLWEYRRSVESAAASGKPPDTVRKCSDPLNDIRQKMTKMVSKGCRITEMTHTGNRFRSKWSCMMEDGVLAIANVISTDGPTAYQDVNESRYGEKITRSVVVATRVGDCAPKTYPP